MTNESIKELLNSYLGVFTPLLHNGANVNWNPVDQEKFVEKAYVPHIEAVVHKYENEIFILFYTNDIIMKPSFCNTAMFAFGADKKVKFNKWTEKDGVNTIFDVALKYETATDKEDVPYKYSLESHVFSTCTPPTVPIMANADAPTVVNGRTYKEPCGADLFLFGDFYCNISNVACLRITPNDASKLPSIKYIVEHGCFANAIYRCHSMFYTQMTKMVARASHSIAIEKNAIKSVSSRLNLVDGSVNNVSDLKPVVIRKSLFDKVVKRAYADNMNGLIDTMANMDVSISEELYYVLTCSMMMVMRSKIKGSYLYKILYSIRYVLTVVFNDISCKYGADVTCSFVFHKCVDRLFKYHLGAKLFEKTVLDVVEGKFALTKLLALFK